MANEQNLIHFNSETAREAQAKSVVSHYKKKMRDKLIASAILEEMSEQDLIEIAQGAIRRAKHNYLDLQALRDTIGEKPTDKTEVAVEENTLNAALNYTSAEKKKILDEMLDELKDG